MQFGSGVPEVERRRMRGLRRSWHRGVQYSNFCMHSGGWFLPRPLNRYIIRARIKAGQERARKWLFDPYVGYVRRHNFRTNTNPISKAYDLAVAHERAWKGRHEA